MIIKVNSKDYEVDAPKDMPLLWVLRDLLGLTGTKYGCGIGFCGTCTVLINGEAFRSCITPISGLEGKEITTIEGLSENGNHPLQQAWLEIGVSQCGYCQPGQIMTAAAMLKVVPKPSDKDIDDYMSDNICRCGTYNKIRQAIHIAAEE